MLDFARLLKVVGDMHDIDSKCVSSYVMQEHGKKAFLVWNF